VCFDLFQVEFELFVFQDVFVRATTLSRAGGKKKPKRDQQKRIRPQNSFNLGLLFKLKDYRFMVSFQISRQNSLVRVSAKSSYILMIFFVKLEHSFLGSRHLTKFLSYLTWKYLEFPTLSKNKIASHGSKMRGSGFRIIFLIFPRKFESVKTSPGFVRRVSALRTYVLAFLS
jgi:hypothetical protein